LGKVGKKAAERGKGERLGKREKGRKRFTYMG